MNPNGPTVPLPTPPTPQALPGQTVATQPACQLPYEFFVTGQINSAGTALTLRLANTGEAGVSLQLRQYTPSGTTPSAPRVYTIGAAVVGVATTAQDVIPIASNGSYDFSIYGPNGFLREFRGNLVASGTAGPPPEVQTCYNVVDSSIRITLDNTRGSAACVFEVTDNVYQANKPVSVTVGAGQSQALVWQSCAGWHDASIRIVGDVHYFRRIAGCVQQQTGPWYTDPAIGNTALFEPVFSIQGSTFSTVRFDYVTPPWQHSPNNWIGVYPPGVAPGAAAALQWVYAPRGIGSVLLASRGSGSPLPAGAYDVWYLFDGGYIALTGSLSLVTTG
jgi:phospholipase C